MKTLVIAEHNNKVLTAATLNLMSAAAKLGAPITVLVAGQGAEAVATAAAAMPNVAEVLHADDVAYGHFLAENMAALTVAVAKDFTHVLAAANTIGKSFMPRVAALLGVAQISDIVDVVDADTFVRPIYAGNALATVQSGDAIKVITIRGSAFAKSAATGGSAAVRKIDALPAHAGSSFVSEEISHSTRPDLAAARVVVSGGRGVGSAENFKLIEGLADKLGAAVGASRAAVDSGYISNDCQVGQTGKSVAPELYIAVGISGAIQHVAGMKDSHTIVAINKDPEAEIFKVADYGLAADMFKAIPEIMEKLGK